MNCTFMNKTGANQNKGYGSDSIGSSNSIILIGMKHCGKSTLGRFLAEQKGIPFYDIDAVIEDLYKKSTRCIYAEDGKKAFMNAEVEACRKIASLCERQNCIIATGGGICDNDVALLVLRPVGSFHYIEVSEKTAFNRILKKVPDKGWPSFIASGKPSSVEEAASIFHDIYIERAEKYRKIADSIENRDDLEKPGNNCINNE